jgi:hypothetical protein
MSIAPDGEVVRSFSGNPSPPSAVCSLTGVCGSGARSLLSLSHTCQVPMSAPHAWVPSEVSVIVVPFGRMYFAALFAYIDETEIRILL